MIRTPADGSEATGLGSGSLEPHAVVTWARLFSGGLAAASGLALTGLVLLRDPGPEEQRLFVVLAMICGMALSTAGQLALLGAVEAPIGTVLRAFRRAVLIGLACAGAIVLQLNSAFTLPNLAFMLLVLLIVEMIFLARRQDAS